MFWYTYLNPYKRDRLEKELEIINDYPGPKSHEISLKNLTQIFSNSSYDPRQRYEAHRRRDIKKVFLRSLEDLLFLKIFKKINRRSSVHF